jgi:hypothetical protein
VTSRSSRTSATTTALAVAALLALAPGAPAATLGVGVADGPGGASKVAARGKVTYRYQYLVGDPASQGSWRHWNPGGSFVTRYVRESVRARVTPVFTYYTLLSASAALPGGEADKDLAGLRDARIMRGWLGDLRLALQRVRESAAGRRVIVHIEPDLWGYVQQRAQADDASTIPAAVGSSGDPDAAGLPDTAAGLAQAVVRLRDRHAPNVRIAWHLSTWGTNRGTTYDDPPPREIDALAARSARFAASLGARFDLIFNDVADRDDGFRRKVLKERRVTHHWGRGDVARHLRWVRGVTRATRTPMVLWQLPLGNRRLPDTWRRYRDNRVDLLLGSRRNLRRARDAGVVALLFGGGADGCTTAQTDGGHFFRLARRYARARLKVR